MQHLDPAIPLQINFAISGVERVVREVPRGAAPRTREQVAARQAVVGLLQSELSSTVTGLLLQCELALETPPACLMARPKNCDRLTIGAEASLSARKQGTQP